MIRCERPAHDRYIETMKLILYKLFRKLTGDKSDNLQGVEKS